MNIYENIYVGSFIYQLGIQVAKKELENMSSVNLFQQTPSDCKLGDLIPSVNGTYLIIEFKRESADKKENEKVKILNFELTKEENEHFIEISKSCHYIGIGTIENEAKINFYKYLEYFTEENPSIRKDFIEQFIHPYNKNPSREMENLYKLLKIGTENYENFIEYLEFLQKIYKTDRKSSTGGIIIHKDETGKLSMLPTNNIEELIRNIHKSINELKINKNTVQKTPKKKKGLSQ